MSDEIPYYQINEPTRGARFYNGTTTIGVSESLTIESNFAASAGKIQQASSSTSGLSNSYASGTIIKFASLSMSGSGNIDGDAIEILKLISYISGNSSLSATIVATKKVSLSASSSQTASFSARVIRKASSSTSANSAVSGTAVKIVKTNNIITTQTASITLTTTALKDFPNVIFTSNSNLTVPNIIRFTPSSRYPGVILSMIDLDGKPLTAQGRQFSSSFGSKHIEKKNWNSSKSRYYKSSSAGKQTFKISWEWLPSDKEQTIDKRFARNFLKDKADDPDVHTLKIYSYGTNPQSVFSENTYNVFITSYSESLIRRDLSNGVYFWKCDIELEEA